MLWPVYGLGEGFLCAPCRYLAHHPWKSFYQHVFARTCDICILFVTSIISANISSFSLERMCLAWEVKAGFLAKTWVFALPVVEVDLYELIRG